MSVTYAPAELESPYGASRLVGLVHRTKGAQICNVRGRSRLCLTWACGGYSIDAVFVASPELPGALCERCEATPVEPPLPVVYRCRSADGRLLYIGSTVNWNDRATWHGSNSPWWPEVASVDKSPRPMISIARREEKAAIKAEAPLYNKQGNIKRFRRDGHAYVPVAEAA